MDFSNRIFFKIQNKSSDETNPLIQKKKGKTIPMNSQISCLNPNL